MNSSCSPDREARFSTTPRTRVRLATAESELRRRRGTQGALRPASTRLCRDDETHDEGALERVAEDKRRTGREIEVGHIFYFGDNIRCDGPQISGPTAHGDADDGSYGVGVSRLVGAVIEASHDDAGSSGPMPFAPWSVGLVTMRADDAPTTAAADGFYAQLKAAGHRDALRRPHERGGSSWVRWT